MRVLITGVSGLVGRTTAARLVGAGHDVVGLSRSAPLELPPQVTHVRGDISDDAVLAKACEGVDAVIHCAFMLDAREGLDAMERTNVGGTRKLIAAAEKTGARRAIFLSSVTVYGPRSSEHEPPRTEASGCLTEISDGCTRTETASSPSGCTMRSAIASSLMT